MWFIEVNTNPCLETSSTLLKNLIPRMVDDAFKLTLDKIFIPPEDAIHKQNYSVIGYEDNFNMW